MEIYFIILSIPLITRLIVPLQTMTSTIAPCGHDLATQDLHQLYLSCRVAPQKYYPRFHACDVCCEVSAIIRNHNVPIKVAKRANLQGDWEFGLAEIPEQLV